MQIEQKQDWVTPELVEYGDVTKLTEEAVKRGGAGDGLIVTLDPWASGEVYQTPNATNL